MSEPVENEKLQFGPHPTGWIDEVFARCGTLCVGCGSDNRVRVYPIVPLDKGGRTVPSNGTVLCKVCYLHNYQPARHRGTRIFKLQISQEQFAYLQARGQEFGSISAFLLRQTQLWLEHSDLFDLLEELPSDREVSVNTTLSIEVYEQLQEVLLRDYTRLPTEAEKQRGKRATTLSVAAALRWLVEDHKAAATRAAAQEEALDEN